MPSLNHRAKAFKAGKCVPNVCRPKYPITRTMVIQEWTNVGEHIWESPSNITRPVEVEYLVVGGGGGGGGSYDNGGSGGGGAGRVLSGTLMVSPGNYYNIVVGDGGVGGNGVGTIASPFVAGSEQNGSDGQSSRFDTVVAGGGRGGYRSRATNDLPGVGGNAAQGINGALGGNGGAGGGAGGGGGGNSSAGGNRDGTAGGIGGNFVLKDITGTFREYGKGGVGGGSANVDGDESIPNRGNGGDGTRASSYDGKPGRKGSAGIVVLKYYVETPIIT